MFSVGVNRKKSNEENVLKLLFLRPSTRVLLYLFYLILREFEFQSVVGSGKEHPTMAKLWKPVIA
jgi:hypothetical protein